MRFLKPLTFALSDLRDDVQECGFKWPFARICDTLTHVLRTETTVHHLKTTYQFHVLVHMNETFVFIDVSKSVVSFSLTAYCLTPSLLLPQSLQIRLFLCYIYRFQECFECFPESVLLKVPCFWWC